MADSKPLRELIAEAKAEVTEEIEEHKEEEEEEETEAHLVCKHLLEETGQLKKKYQVCFFVSMQSTLNFQILLTATNLYASYFLLQVK